VVFVIDSTGSMDPYIEEVKQKVLGIIMEIEEASITPHVSFGIVVYGDHPPQDSIVTKSFPLTSNHQEILDNVHSLPRTGGGDYPEAVVDGLHEGIEMSWHQGSHRVMVLMGDAPPHGCAGTHDDYSDGFPSGCPCGLDPFQEALNAMKKGIIIYAVGVSATRVVKESFSEIAKKAEGEYLDLSSAGNLSGMILRLLGTEVAKMETDMRTYDVIEKTQLVNAEYLGKTIGISREQAEESIARLEKKGLVPLENRIRVGHYCRYCGTLNREYARFCRNCGKPFHALP
jgi:hypothetical protein